MRIVHQHMRKAGGTSVGYFLGQHLRSTNVTKTEIEWYPLPTSMLDDPDTLVLTHLREPISRLLSAYLFEGGLGCCIKVERGTATACNSNPSDTKKNVICTKRMGANNITDTCPPLGSRLGDFLPFDKFVAVSRAMIPSVPDWSDGLPPGHPRQHWPLRPRPHVAELLQQEVLHQLPKEPHYYFGRPYFANYYIKMILGLPPGANVGLRECEAAEAVLRRYDAVMITERFGDLNHLRRIVNTLPPAFNPREVARRRNFLSMPRVSGWPGYENTQEHALMREISVAHSQTLEEVKRENHWDSMLYNRVRGRAALLDTDFVAAAKYEGA